MSRQNWQSSGKYIALGIALGATFGIAFDNLSLGIGFGVVLGAAFSYIYKKK
ncbi:hypothetical protein V7056_06825 [Bacillus sp. JJ664]